MIRRRNSSRTAVKAEMNVIPFLDVLLVLLLILMVTTPVIQQHVQVKLPQAREAKVNGTPAARQIILEISAPGCYALIMQGKRLENLPQQQVIMQSRMQLQDNAQNQFLIAGAAMVPYDEILKGLSLLHQAGITAVGLMTQPL